MDAGPDSSILRARIQLFRLQLEQMEAELGDGGADPIGLLTDWITPGDACKLSGMTKKTMRRRCSENMIEGQDGFAMWVGTGYSISRSRFLTWLRTNHEAKIRRA